MKTLRWHYNRIKAYIGRPRLLVQERPVILDETVYCKQPIFIIGVHRSGTSLVRRLFNSHGDIACPPESFFIENYARMFEDPMVLSGYDAFGYNAEQARADLARKASALHEAYRITQGKTHWADKTPQYARCLDPIDKLFGGSPFYVLIYRHPWDIAHSIAKRGWNFTDIKDPFESALVYVRDTIAMIRKFEAEHPDRTTRIVYRELCEDPETVLQGALSRIGIEYDPGMLDFAEKNHNYGLEDPTIRGRKSIELTVGAWKSWSKEQQDRAQQILGLEDYQDIC